jgi:glycosyltransferase involved in cell wall biosynthesis
MRVPRYAPRVLRPDVSILVAAYRPEPHWLRDAVGSLLGQQGVDHEVVVIDDGSPEPVAPLLEDVRDPRLRVERIQHGGLSAARNAGIEASRGRHVRFYDADDIAEPASTARLLALAGGRHISYGATAICDEHLRVRWVMRAHQQGDAAIDGLLGRFPVRPQSVLIPRAVVDDVGPWDTRLRLSNDWDFIQRALEVAQVRGETRIASYYRRHGTALTANFEVGLAEAKYVVERYFERHPAQRGTGVERQALAMLDAHAARVLATHGRRGQAVRRGARSMLRDPRALGTQGRQALVAVGGILRRQHRSRG